MSIAVGYPHPEAAQLRTLLAISGIKLDQDPLLSELIEFRGSAAELLIDAHPLIRMFAVVEALEHQSETEAARLADQRIVLRDGCIERAEPNGK